MSSKVERGSYRSASASARAGLTVAHGIVDNTSVVAVRIRRGDDAPPYRFGQCLDRVAHFALLSLGFTNDAPRIHTQAFPKRSLSTGIAQKSCCCSERREIMARRESRDEVAKLLMRCLIGKSTGEGVERPKLQPARPLSDGDLNGAAQRSGGGFAFSAAICELTVESPQLGLEIALVAAVCPREPLACCGSSLVELPDDAASPGEKKECVGQVEGLPVGTRARHRPHDLLDAHIRSLADFQPAPKRLQGDHEVALGKVLPYKVCVREELGEAGEIFGFGRDDRRVSDDVPQGHRMIEIDGQGKSRSRCLVGPAGVSGPQLDPGPPYEANRLRVLGVQRQMFIAMGYVIGFDRAIEIVAGSGQYPRPERAHAEEIAALCPGDRIMTHIVEEVPGEFLAIVEAAALQPGEAETTEDRRVHRSVKLAAKRKGSLVELVRILGTVALKGNKGGSEGDPDVEFECIAVG